MKLFVWDFHGTLERGIDVATIQLSNEVLAEHGYTERFASEQAHKLYGLRWQEYFARLLPYESEERHVALAAACFEKSNPVFIRQHIRPNDSAIKVLSTIGRWGHQQIVVSNTRQEGLYDFLNAVSMGHFFPEGCAFGVETLNGAYRSKARVLENFVRGRSFDDIVVVGDMDADMEMGKAVNATTYAYTPPGRPFKTAGDYQISDLCEVLREL